MPRAEVERLRKGRFAGGDGLVTMGLAILGPYYSTWDVTRADVLLAREFDLIASMHVGGGTPLTPDGFVRLAREKLFSPRFAVVHGNDIPHDEIRMIVDGGGMFTVTAEVELQTGYGDPLTGVVQALGSPVSIGSDVEPMARGDVFSCMRITLQHERHRSIIDTLGKTGRRPETIPVTVRQALEWGTINGAKMAGLDRRTGSLTPGKQADITLLRASDLNMFPLHEPAAAIVTYGGVANVDTVLVAGRVVKRAGKLLYPQLLERMRSLAASGERILTDFDRLPRRAA